MAAALCGVAGGVIGRYYGGEAMPWVLLASYGGGVVGGAVGWGACVGGRSLAGWRRP